MSSTQPNQQPSLSVSVPAYRKLQCTFFAACIFLAPLVIFLGFVFDPQLGVPQTANAYSAYIVAARAENPVLFQWFLFFNVITPYVFPLSYLGLGWLAMRRSPWLATIGIACGFAGSLPWPLFVGQEALVHGIMQIGENASLVALVNHFTSEWVVLLLFISWIIGHQLGYILLGIALFRAHEIPLWAACLFVVSFPFQIAAYLANNGIFQLIYFALIFIGSIPAALAMLKFRDESQPMCAYEEPASTR